MFQASPYYLTYNTQKIKENKCLKMVLKKFMITEILCKKTKQSSCKYKIPIHKYCFFGRKNKKKHCIIYNSYIEYSQGHRLQIQSKQWRLFFSKVIFNYDETVTKIKVWSPPTFLKSHSQKPLIASWSDCLINILNPTCSPFRD